jgi:hypothetical protein
LHFTLLEETNSDKTPLTGQNTLGNLNRQPKNQVLKDQLEKGWPNGLAQRQRRDWRNSLPIIAYSGKPFLHGAAEPLSDWSWCWAAGDSQNLAFF